MYDELIKQAAPFCQYGPGYNRHVHTSSAHLRTAIDRGYEPSILKSLAAELQLRLDYWDKRTASTTEHSQD